jgi:putative ABC transport system substrate-binding protein
MKKLLFISIIIIIAITIFLNQQPTNHLPTIAIANYGPHSSLDATIKGIKTELARQDCQVNYDILDVGFDTSLIPQMIIKLKTKKPTIMVAMTTPVAQFAKNAVKDIPLVFADITDPVSAGLLKTEDQIDGNMTGASERQNLELLLAFAKEILPNATRVGILYSTAEANDITLVKMLEQAALASNMQVIAVPIDQPRDVHMRMQSFNNKVDFIYVGTSGPIQPTLPTIVAQADAMNIPIFNADSDAVKQHQVLASFGVDYEQVGINAGNIIASILKDNKMLPPSYPNLKDHHAFISKVRAERYKVNIPANATILE